MIRGLQISARGMEAQAARQDVIANNLANANTAGFKPDQVAFKAFQSVFTRALGELNGGVAVDAVAPRFEQGAVMDTGNPLDVALVGDGFLVVQTPEGDRYTRNGSLSIDGSGQLCTSQGYPVMGDSGPIIISGTAVDISEDGAIFVDGQKVNTLRLVDFEQPYALTKYAGQLYQAADAAQPSDSVENLRVKQGAVEGSAVTVVREMVNMIDMLRQYEANQKAILAQDSLLDKAVNQVGRV